MTLARIELAELGADAQVLVATHRLARQLSLAHDRLQRGRGLARWRTLAATTPAAWLAQLLERAALLGDAGAGALPRALSEAQERVLWERAIGEGSRGLTEAALLDREGLGRAAQEANALLEVWRLRLDMDSGGASEETQHFLRWRARFLRLCRSGGWAAAAHLTERQLDCLDAGAGALPAQVALAGFDRYNPQEARLIASLERRGVAVCALQLGRQTPAPGELHVFADRLAECRAAVAWARQRLETQADARLALVVPELASLREPLAALLDDALDPACNDPALAEAPRRYNFSLGASLGRRGIVATAMRWLEVAAQPWHLEQERFGALLRDPYWSAAAREADGRARLEAALRERLPATLSLAQIVRYTEQQAQRGLGLDRSLADLVRFQAQLAAAPARLLPSAWAARFLSLLEAVGWPGERPLSSHEYQAQSAYAEVIASLGQLDPLLGKIGIGAAQRRLAQLCRDRVFQPETEREPALEVMGLLEALAEPLDGLWVMGMNAHLWPPPADPNPLLPARAQRAAQTPGASVQVQSDFAAAILRRLLASAAEVHFSWARVDGDRSLRPSPLVAGMAAIDVAAAQACGPIEALAGTGRIEQLDDSEAPPVAPHQSVRGGTALLAAQARCPAWAYYRYRLGAKALAIPALGLSAGERGALLHATLARLWAGRASQELAGLAEAERAALLAAAVAAALEAFAARRQAPLGKRLAAVEADRLRALTRRWMDFELQRSLPFRVIACERESEIDIGGLKVRVVVDRIDALADGRAIVVDYKSGKSGSAASWGAARIDEPQLPIYAAYAVEHPAAVVLARVRADDPGYAGIAAEPGLLPKVAGIAEAGARRIFPDAADWDSLMRRWRERLAAVAAEILRGDAAVVFASDSDLANCEVLPLLRLAERRAQLQEAERHARS